MEIDEDDEEATDEEDEDAEDNDEDTSMAVDQDGQPSGSQKKPKLKPRKSQLNFDVFNDNEAVRKLTSADTEKLRLQIKYHSDALNFIQHIEEAMGLLEQMLGSKNKAEVLEAMEFFKIAQGFDFESAKVRCFFPLAFRYF